MLGMMPTRCWLQYLRLLSSLVLSGCSHVVARVLTHSLSCGFRVSGLGFRVYQTNLPRLMMLHAS